LIEAGRSKQVSASEVEAHVRGYIERWNARDCEAIWSRFYRLDASSHLTSQADLQAILDDLAAQGFDHTRLHSVQADMLGADRAQARIRFTRFRTDGTAMSDTDRGAEYHLSRFPDGWRITLVRTTD
jgi:hypothetical protein